jgi:L-2,4-diaminobutyrate transaminase
MPDDSLRNLPLEQIDRDHVIHPMTGMGAYARGELGDPRIVEGGSGVRIRDSKGNELIDAFAGLYCVNIGYGQTKVAEAIAEQAHKLAYFHAYAGHSHEPVIRLSERIAELAPEGLNRVYYGLSGSDANETQAKLVWYYHNVTGRPEKKKIISRHRGYHGASVMAGSLTGLPIFHTMFDLPLQMVRHTTAPDYYWEAAPGMSERDFSKKCAKDLEDLILAEGPETVGAFIGEPMLGTGGIVPPPEGYWEEIQAVLKKYDILLIADEVVCGFGRMGTNFGSQFYGIQPDLISVAKGLTSAYLPLSGCIVGERVWKAIEQGSDELGVFNHGWTYSAHPVCAAAALANLDVIAEQGLTENAARTGAHFIKGLKEAFGGHAHLAEVRGDGLIAAVEFVADPATKTPFDKSVKVAPVLAAACLDEGVICRAMPHGNILGFAPPLILTPDEADEIIDKVSRAVKKGFDKLAAEGKV